VKRRTHRQRTGRDFGDAAAELLAARDATIISPLSHLGVIEVSGPEAAVFLHHQLTSDVKHLAAAKRRNIRPGVRPRADAGQLSGFPRRLRLSIATVRRPAASDPQAPADVRPAQQGDRSATSLALAPASVSRVHKRRRCCSPPACRCRRPPAALVRCGGGHPPRRQRFEIVVHRGAARRSGRNCSH
jgi:hypothetical protein